MANFLATTPVEKFLGAISTFKSPQIHPIYDLDGSFLVDPATGEGYESFEELVFDVAAGTYDARTLASMKQIYGSFTQAGMNGVSGFFDIQQERFKALQGWDINPTDQQITDFAQRLVHDYVYQDQVDLVHELNALPQVDAYACSGSYHELIDPLAERLGVKSIAQNFIRKGDGQLWFDESSPMSRGKVEAVTALDLPGVVIMTGDGMTDAKVHQALIDAGKPAVFIYLLHTADPTKHRKMRGNVLEYVRSTPTTIACANLEQYCELLPKVVEILTTPVYQH